MAWGRVGRVLAPGMAVVVLATGCASAPRPVIVPARGQTAAELDRDQFECRLEAQEQAGAGGGTALRNGAILGLLALGAFGSALGALVGAASGAAGDGAIAGAVVGGAIGAPAGGTIAVIRNENARARFTRLCLEARGYRVELAAPARAD